MTPPMHEDIKRLVEAARAVVDSGCLVDAPTCGGEALSVHPDALEALRQALASRTTKETDHG